MSRWYRLKRASASRSVAGSHGVEMNVGRAGIRVFSQMETDAVVAGEGRGAVQQARAGAHRNPCVEIFEQARLDADRLEQGTRIVAQSPQR